MIIEELDPFIEEHVKTLGIQKAKAKHPSYRTGELDPGLIRPLVEGKPKKVKPGPTAPRLCAGCPHWSTFSVLKNLIFCGRRYRLLYPWRLPPTSALHSCICMGAGVTLQEGLRRAHPDGKIVGVIGDSTFVHSALPG